MYINKRNLRQCITHWGATPDGYGGHTYGEPSHVKGRWEFRNVTYTSSKGEVVGSDALVYLSCEVSNGDFIYLGRATEVDPTTLEGARRIVQVNEIPGLRNTEVQIKAFL